MWQRLKEMFGSKDNKVSFVNTIFLKCTVLIAFVIAIVVGILTWQMLVLKDKIAMNGASVLAREITQSVASNAGSSLRFENLSDLQRLLANTIDTSDNYATYAVVVDTTGSVLVSVGDVAQDQTVDVATLSHIATQTENFETTNDGLYAAAPIWFGTSTPTVLGAVGIIWTAAPAINQTASELRRVLLTTLILFVSVVILSAFLLRHTVSRPLNILNAAVAKLELGHLDQSIPLKARRDEIGQIACRLASLRTSLQQAKATQQDRKHAQAQQNQVVETLSHALQRLANGDFGHPLNDPFNPEYEPLRSNYNTAVDKLRVGIGSVISNAKSIRLGSEEISQSSDDLSQRTETQAATLEETAVALDQITNSVRETAKDSREVETIVTKATQTAQGGSEVVRSAVDAMAAINDSSNQIGQIISVIDDIAFQTNLLALNAGVEAARAGEAGRGFAVVASEVRALAQRSSDAAREIKSLIQDSSQQVANGVKLVDKAGKELTKIVSSVSNIADLMTNIANSAAGQSHSIGEINLGVTQLDHVTQQNAAMVEQMTAASYSLKSDAQDLETEISRFKINGSEPEWNPSEKPSESQLASTPIVEFRTAR